jgi:hypothetical protein
MEIETVISNHKRITRHLGRVIEDVTHSQPVGSTPILLAVIEGKIDVLRSLGVRIKAVTELEAKLAACKAEIGKGAAPKPEMKIKDLEFKEVSAATDDNRQWAHHGEFGSITILDRMTGFGWRDIETGFRSPDNKFWLASGGFDIRDFPDLTVSEAIEKIKENANTCVAA